MVDAPASKSRDFFLKLFDIRTGEFRRAWLMLLNIFLLIQCLWMIKPVVNAQFLHRVGIEKLPFAFLLVALTAVVFSPLYSKVLHQLRFGKILFRTHLFSIIALITFAILLHFPFYAKWMVYIFYIAVALWSLIATSQFWLLANFLFNPLEAKRLFGFIGAGAIAGGISGGYLTSLLSQFMDSKDLLFVAAGFLVVHMLLNIRIWRSFLRSFDSAKQFRQARTLNQYPLKLIRSSKHLTFLSIIVGIGVLVSKLIEYQFSAIASENITDPDKLTSFFGFWFSTSNAVSLIIQLILTQRLVAFLGVGRSLFILPGALFASATAVLYAPVLWTGTTLKLLDISLKQSVNKAATELLILPVPMAIKSQAKSYIDVFVDTTATGVGGIILIFLINALNLPGIAVTIMVLVLISVWIYYAFRARKEYILSFQRQLGVSDQPKQQKQVHLSETAIAEFIRTSLQTGSREQILFLLENIEDSKDPGFMKDVIPLLQHTSARVRLAALGCLYYHTDHSITKDIEPLLKDPDDEVRFRAFSCMLTHTRKDRVSFINQYLNDPDLAISGSALVGLATETRGNPKMQREFSLEQRLLDRIEDAANSKDAEQLEDAKVVMARSIGYGQIQPFYPLLHELIEDENPVVVKHAITAAGNSQDTGFVHALIALLPNITTRPLAQKALAKFKAEELLPILTEFSTERKDEITMLAQIPELAEDMETEEAIDFLFNLLIQHRHPVIKFETLEVLHRMKSKFPRLSIGLKRIMPLLMEETDLYKDTLAISYAAQHRGDEAESPELQEARKELIELLERKLDHNLKRIFWLLGLSYPPGTIQPLYTNIRHQDQQMRISAVEFLDNILEPNVKKAIISIVESAVLEQLTPEDLDRLEIKVHSQQECYDAILNGNDEQLKHAVQRIIAAAGD